MKNKQIVTAHKKRKELTNTYNLQMKAYKKLHKLVYRLGDLLLKVDQVDIIHDGVAISKGLSYWRAVGDDIQRCGHVWKMVNRKEPVYGIEFMTTINCFQRRSASLLDLKGRENVEKMLLDWIATGKIPENMSDYSKKSLTEDRK